MKNRMLSFQEFEQMYESYGFVYEATDSTIPPPTQSANQLINSKTGESKEDIEDLLSIFDDIAGEPTETTVDEANSTGTKKKVNTLKVVKLGEESDRVKKLQEILGVKPADGIFGKVTDAAVKKFQTENSLTVDGKVGTQTYGKMLEVIKKVDPKNLESEVAKALAVASSVSVAIYNNPIFYQIFTSVTIVIVNNVTYVVAVPRNDAKTNIQKLKLEGTLTSGYEWLENAGRALGKALLFTTLGVAVISLEIASSMINGAISVLKFVGKGAVSAVSDIFHGLAQVAKWVKKAGSAAFNTISNTADKLWSGYVSVMAPILKATAEGLIAFVSAVSNYLGKVGLAFANLAFVILQPIGDALGLAWKGLKLLSQAAKSGLDWIAKKGKEALISLKDTITSGYNWAKEKGTELGQQLLSDGRGLAKTATKAIGSGITFAGNKISEFGGWVSNLFESAFQETGDPIYEAVLATF